MKNTKQKNIEVYAHWSGLIKPTLMGVLKTIQIRGKEIFSFEYDASWLQSNEVSLLDPSLQWFPGRQYPPQERENFGLFLDSSPDRWGRFLMDRREAILAREENREEQVLLSSDYLLGVCDQHRIGALRFRTDPDGDFLDNNKHFSSPPWASLRELEHASLEIEKTNSDNKKSYSKWIQMLIAPGGSLGGARPKASVMDEKNHLWIAKFPSGNDIHNVGAWEMVACELANLAGINMATALVKKYNSKHHTFITRRFDRTHSGERIHFASAMTLLQRDDGDDGSTGASYLEIAEYIARCGSEPEKDLEQLWRRIVFFICISNVDDHLRNHGFILEKTGWKLSPAFDINPVPEGNGLKLNISEKDNSQEISIAIEVSKYFRISSKQASRIVQEVICAVKKWRKKAKELGISSSEQERIKRAFRIADNTLEKS